MRIQTGRFAIEAVGALLALAFFGAGAQAADAAPAPAPVLKVLGDAAPTNLPPRQSEVQKVTVEGEGGTFELAQPRVKGTGTPVYLDAELGLTKGSKIATVESVTGAGTAEVGDRVTEPEGYFGSYIVSCSSDCMTPNSTIELSEPAETTESGARRQILTRELSGVVGDFQVGEQVLSALNYAGEPPYGEPFFPSETVVTAVGPGTITLSKPTDGEYSTSEGAIGPLQLTTGPVSAPIPFDAPAADVQAALEGALGGGTVTVTGGPGGNAATPYLVVFGGPQAERDVPQLDALFAGLAGAHSFVRVSTTIPGGNGTGEIVALPANIGPVPSTGKVTVEVGPLPPGIVTSGPASGKGWICPEGKGASSVTCMTTQALRAIHATPFEIGVPIEIEAGAAPESSIDVKISGGGSRSPDTYRVPIVVSREPASFGVQAAFGGSTEADGSASTQAGGHPFQASVYAMLNTRRLPVGELVDVIEPLVPVGDSKEVLADLPPGFVGNPLVGDRCPQAQLAPPDSEASNPGPLCDEDTTVGNLDPVISQITESARFNSKLYNDMPPNGAAAEFTTVLAGFLQSVIASVHSGESYEIHLGGPNNPNSATIFGVLVLFEGVPEHGSGAAFLTNPTDCAESRANPPFIRAIARSYQEPDTFRQIVLPQPPLTGCDKLKFEAEDPATGKGQVGFSFTPISEAGGLVSTGSTPVAAEAHLHIDQAGLTDPNALATPHLKRAVIKLPEGMFLNPSSADGLQGCSEAQIGYKGNFYPMPNPIRFDESQPSCPDGSKLGTAEIRTPLLDNPLVGEVFLANQEENPFGSLLAVYLVVNDPLTGVLVKLPGEVRPDPTTGRLTAIFDDNPQLPFEDLYLHFRGGGPRSLFATSEVCGSFPTESTMTPWSAPESGPPAETSSSFALTSNCVSSPSARPFSPSFEAGTTAAHAGSHEPLVVKVARKDGEQELTAIDFTLPKGLIGKIAGIPYCTPAQIADAERKSGREEQGAPSCSARSQVGTVDAGAGVGPLPFHVGGKVYLAGPYKGAPISTVAVVPAVAGPLDLGDVVVRAPLYIDHESAALTAKTDPIPTILKGIPLKIRSVTIDVDRPGFILNPTNCTPATITSSLGGDSGASAHPTYRFQAAGCKSLKFAPKLKIALKGKTKRGGHPALTATLTQPPGQANIGEVSVALPRSEFLEQGHIRTNCTRVQFAAEACPAGSIYGHAEAVTPLLDQPLAGPVYLRSSSHRLPDLAVVLKGPADQPIEIDLDGRIDSVHGGIRTTFEAVPDAPVSKFVLRLPAGKKSLLVNSTNICEGRHGAAVAMTGQNGLEYAFSTPLRPRCRKGKAKDSGKRSGQA